ncbi:TerC family protein [Cytobacillus oceanisediminis]|jgi:YjbE family integral membrane protein|uniref:TerC family protein n=1 Tax=Cytobacillus oceanisediminis TaxID=665099 RepID=UPI0001F456D3|nr:TerC family protein [Cytobacillus oceanisediminis]EFV76643.1 hypothetical protein HMPREF1013_03188 [Bacillus sp. 2_A_57_CT2]MBU8733541.1 TerC family protein [Cytobacillus oceanisediminis]MCM3530151.1 TerC family protein [Cytobacillus oceanisediminis]
MDIFSVEFIISLLTIIVTDLILAGDNAIVIGLAARKLPKEQQKKAIILGTVGAIIIRTIATIVVVYLLKVPGLHLIGGVLLLWITYKFISDEDSHKVKTQDTLWDAIRTIIIADAAMGIDNVLAVAGAAQGSFLLVILGLFISIPVVVWCSTIILKFMEKYPIIIVFGSGVLAWTASKMIAEEPILGGIFTTKIALYSFEVLVVAVVIAIGYKKIIYKQS